MKRYRSKPVIIEAVRFESADRLPVGVRPETRQRCSDPQCGDSTWDHECDLGGETGRFLVDTMGGPALIALGDYVVTEPDGAHHYPVKPKIFEKRYELIDEAPINPLVKLIPIPSGTPASLCKKCPAVIYLVPGKNVGKFIPLAIEPQLETKLGIVSTLARAPTSTEDGYGYPHFADCPAADSFRKPS